MKKLTFQHIALLGFVLAIGCQPAATETAGKADVAAQGEHDGHDHGAHGNGHDDHGHGETGPHGGHFLHLEPSGAHAEWTHDDEAHLITVFLDDFDAAKLTGVKFVVEIPDAGTEEFPLTATDNGWTVTSESLMTHMEMGEAVKVKLVVSEESGEQSTTVEHTEHDHHNH